MQYILTEEEMSALKRRTKLTDAEIEDGARELGRAWSEFAAALRPHLLVGGDQEREVVAAFTAFVAKTKLPHLAPLIYGQI